MFEIVKINAKKTQDYRKTQQAGKLVIVYMLQHFNITWRNLVSFERNSTSGPARLAIETQRNFYYKIYYTARDFA